MILRKKTVQKKDRKPNKNNCEMQLRRGRTTEKSNNQVLRKRPNNPQQRESQGKAQKESQPSRSERESTKNHQGGYMEKDNRFGLSAHDSQFMDPFCSLLETQSKSTNLNMREKNRSRGLLCPKYNVVTCYDDHNKYYFVKIR